MSLPETQASPLLRFGEFSPIIIVLLRPSVMPEILIDAVLEQSPKIPRNGAEGPDDRGAAVARVAVRVLEGDLRGVDAEVVEDRVVLHVALAPHVVGGRGGDLGAEDGQIDIDVDPVAEQLQRVVARAGEARDQAQVDGLVDRVAAAPGVVDGVVDRGLLHLRQEERRPGPPGPRPLAVGDRVRAGMSRPGSRSCVRPGRSA